MLCATCGAAAAPAAADAAVNVAASRAAPGALGSVGRLVGAGSDARRGANVCAQGVSHTSKNEGEGREEEHERGA